MEKENARLTLFVGKTASIVNCNFTDERWSKLWFKKFGVGPLSALYNPWRPLLGGLDSNAPYIDVPYYDPLKGRRTGFDFRIVFTDLEFEPGRHVLEKVPGLKKLVQENESLRSERDYYVRAFLQVGEMLKTMGGDPRIQERVIEMNNFVIKKLSRVDPAMMQYLNSMGKR